MHHRTLLLSACLLLAPAILAQTEEGKQEPAKKEPAKQEPAGPKDDAMTTNDQAIVAIDKFIQSDGPDKKQADWRMSLKQPPKLTFAKDAQYFWHLKTNKGEIQIKLLADVAPMHVSSTLYLSRLGFYDGLVFHRVIKGFMAQGGCPQGSGRGGPGYKYAGEFDPKVKHDRPGLLSMANAGPGTDGSQFFLTFVKTPHLDGKHTIFGEVAQGMEAVKALEQSGSDTGTPTEKLMIEKSWISVAAAKPADKKEPPAAPAKGKGGL